MEKKYCFLIFGILISVFILNPLAFAQNTQATIDNATLENEELEDDTLDDDLFEDYDDTIEPQSIADPLYYFNYAMYSFNDFLYFAAIKPISTGYKFIMPTTIRKGVNNFFHNLLFPLRFVNNFLQWEVRDAGTEIEIFLINS
ncbi:MAG: VacJ family lipoprotein, partial [Deltaproteobacteria bacterium]